MTGLPVVAIVGRPNVGKSTLFNRLVRARRAIVDDVPGVTRDRIVAVAQHDGREFLCVDTGGFAAEAGRHAADIVARVRAQALQAVEEADAVVCVFDAQAGLLPEERDLVQLLRRTRKPVLWAVNKVDTEGRGALLADFYAAGATPLLAVSGAHGRGLPDLADAIVATLPPAPASAPATTGTRLALIGRPNVGKSSLLNRLLGAERAIVAPEAGTTRDAVDTALAVDGRPYVLIDTAGIRKQGHVRERLERHGAVRALGTLARTDLVLVVLDAAEGITDQDARLVGRAWEAGRGVILVANKWDTVSPPQRDRAAFRRRMAELRRAFADLPLLCVSAKTGDGIDEIFPTVRRVEDAYRATLPTPALNRAIAAAAEAQPPPTPRGRPIRLFYATQTGREPPSVTVFTNQPAAVSPAYIRFLTGRLAREFRLVGVPIRLQLRARRASDVTGSRSRGTGAGGRRSSPPKRAGGRPRRR